MAKRGEANEERARRDDDNDEEEGVMMVERREEEEGRSEAVEAVTDDEAEARVRATRSRVMM